MEEQLIRLDEAGIIMSEEDKQKYLSAPDEIKIADNVQIPPGYKKCGHCKTVKKLYLFNRNSQAKNNCTGNCKACQKATSKKSYDKTKDKRDYKRYYEANREKKLEQSRKYYQENKDSVLTKQKKYHSSKKGRKVMKRAHAKRKYLLEKNAGIPWTRDIIIDRDKMTMLNGKLVKVSEVPICILCSKPIIHDRDIHMEHLLPVVMDGKDCFTNVGCAHQLCNLQKSKDAREITVEQVQDLITRSEAYIDMHPELFDEKVKNSKVDEAEFEDLDEET